MGQAKSCLSFFATVGASNKTTIYVFKRDKVNLKVRLSNTVNLEILRTDISSHIQDTVLILTVQYPPKSFIKTQKNPITF